MNALLALAVLLAAEKDTATGAAPAGPGIHDSIRNAVAGFVEAQRARISGPGGLEGLRHELRVFAGDLDGRISALETAPARRPALSKTARQALAAGLAGAGAPAAAADAAVDLAFREHLKGRREKLEREIMCWCPTENWTRTLAGCAEGCAEEQKGFVRDWLAAGFTDAEIVERMVAQPKGGPRVRAVPEATGTNRLGFIAPFACLAAAAVVLALVLRRVVRRSSPDRTPAGTNGEAPPPDGEDDEIGRRIERELEEMER